MCVCQWCCLNLIQMTIWVYVDKHQQFDLKRTQLFENNYIDDTICSCTEGKKTEITLNWISERWYRMRALNRCFWLVCQPYTKTKCYVLTNNLTHRIFTIRKPIHFMLKSMKPSSVVFGFNCSVFREKLFVVFFFNFFYLFSKTWNITYTFT